MSDNGTSWASVIPEFFYELIGRIIPGGTFILGLIYTIDQTFLCEVILKQKMDGSPIDLPYFVIFIVFLGLSYSAGFLLTPFGDILGKLFYKSQYRNISNIDQLEGHNNQLLVDSGFLKEKKNNSKQQPGSTSPNEENNTSNQISTGVSNDRIIKNLSWEKFDWLYQCHHNLAKDGYPKQSRSLSKSAADVQLCINTSAAFFIIAIAPPVVKLLLHLFVDKSINICISFNDAVALVIAGGFYWAAYYRNKRYLLRLFSFSLEAHKVKIEKGGLYEY